MRLARHWIVEQRNVEQADPQCRRRPARRKARARREVKRGRKA
jgi:hypothetical protein